MVNDPKKLVLDESVTIYKNTHNVLVHFMALAESNHDDIIKLIDLLEHTNNDCKKAEEQKNEMKIVVESLTRENENLATELQTTQDKHRESKARIAALFATNQSLENEIQEYKKRFNSVKMILRENCGKFGVADKLMELPFLNAEDEKVRPSGGNLSPPSSRQSQETNDPIDYDKTGEGDSMGDIVDLRFNRTYRRSKEVKNARQPTHSMKRRSASQPPISSQPVSILSKKLIDPENYPTPAKRQKDDYDVNPTTRIKMDSNGKTPSKGTVTIQRCSLNRSLSESNLIEEKKTPSRANCLSTLDMRSPMVGFGSNWTKGRPIDECTHSFINSRAFLGSCYVCLKGFKIKCLKCQTCKINIHEGCQANAPMPCIPYVETPQKQHNQRPRLADFCPNSQPKIPAIIIRCVVALERGYLNTIGLYRVPGSDNEIKKLYEDLRSRYSPRLNNRDPEVITGCIKKFLRDLREPLIPTSSYKEFVTAVEKNDEEMLMAAISELPIPNRDTLAYLCAHWQKVSSNANVNQMPLENLATCLGPTIVGSTSKFGCLQNNSRANQQSETRRQNQVLLSLLKLDSEYWKTLLEYPANMLATPKTLSRTPRVMTSSRKINEFDANCSLLGPITTPPVSLIQPMSPSRRITPSRPFFERPY